MYNPGPVQKNETQSLYHAAADKAAIILAGAAALVALHCSDGKSPGLASTVPKEDTTTVEHKLNNLAWAMRDLDFTLKVDLENAVENNEALRPFYDSILANANVREEWGQGKDSPWQMHYYDKKSDRTVAIGFRFGDSPYLYTRVFKGNVEPEANETGLYRELTGSSDKNLLLSIWDYAPRGLDFEGNRSNMKIEGDRVYLGDSSLVYDLLHKPLQWENDELKRVYSESLDDAAAAASSENNKIKGAIKRALENKAAGKAGLIKKEQDRLTIPLKRALGQKRGN
ncbi:MAG: hypothetical protein QS98_C0003G0063 [archaeon GW2011_AR3]|nr:MAG: hypothetical protein QS98_C0003G0063 [archaeon GW2011_AR3]MBS3110105.1 hypothetical protein [Candidatus Woesearchaeota archaeon]